MNPKWTGGKVEHLVHRNRVYRNGNAEEDFTRRALDAGWTFGKRGWPDFWCVINGEFACVEVKPAAKWNLRPDQQRVMNLLIDQGIKCFTWSPTGGLKRVRRSRETVGTPGPPKGDPRLTTTNKFVVDPAVNTSVDAAMAACPEPSSFEDRLSAALRGASGT